MVVYLRNCHLNLKLLCLLGSCHHQYSCCWQTQHNHYLKFELSEIRLSLHTVQAEMIYREKHYLLCYHCLGYASLYWATRRWLRMTAYFCCPYVLPGHLPFIQANFLHCCCWVFRYYIAVIVRCVWLSLGWAKVSTLILMGLQLPQLFINKFHNNWKSSILTLRQIRNHSVLGEFVFIQSWSSSQLYEANLCFLQLSEFSFRSRRPILIIIISRNNRLAKSLSHWQILTVEHTAEKQTIFSKIAEATSRSQLWTITSIYLLMHSSSRCSIFSGYILYIY